jgi:hypothetical protein
MPCFGPIASTPNSAVRSRILIRQTFIRPYWHLEACFTYVLYLSIIYVPLFNNNAIFVPLILTLCLLLHPTYQQ